MANPLRMQPTFRLELDAEVEEAAARLRQALKESEPAGLADAAGRSLDFRVEPGERRLWSPHLSVQLGETEAGAEAFGRFAPRPEVWTLVMMVYFGMATAAFAGGVYGCVQAMLGHRPWALLAIPIGVAVVVALHAASLIGQRLSADQMVTLRERFDAVVQRAFGEG